jgi:hypothetical protein
VQVGGKHFGSCSISGRVVNVQHRDRVITAQQVTGPELHLTLDRFSLAAVGRHARQSATHLVAPYLNQSSGSPEIA